MPAGLAARSDPGGRAAAIRAAAIRAAAIAVALAAAATEAGRPVAAAEPAAPAVARDRIRPEGHIGPGHRAAGPEARVRPPGTAPGPGTATAADAPTVMEEGIVRPSIDPTIGRVPARGAASASAARPGRRAARQAGRRAARVRGPGTARGIGTALDRPTPTVRDGGSDRTTAAGRVRAPRTGSGPRAPACRPGRGIDMKVRPPERGATRAARAGWTGRPQPDPRARRTAPGLLASPGAIAAEVQGRVRTDDRGSPGHRPTDARIRPFPKRTWSTTTRS